MKIILLNGPPRSGKDYAAATLFQHFAGRYSRKWERFSLPHKVAFAAMVNAPVTNQPTLNEVKELVGPGIVTGYEDRKSEIIPRLGCSYRQWQIDFSEKFMKPLYGQDIFARLFIERIKVRLHEEGWLCIVSDCGFQIEYDALIREVDPRNVLLLRLEREDCDFSGDSREYITTHGNANSVVWNAGDKTFAPLVVRLVEDWLNGERA